MVLQKVLALQLVARHQYLEQLALETTASNELASQGEDNDLCIVRADQWCNLAQAGPN